jgi:hypothetical protein
MSFAEYLRTKSAGTPVVLETRKPTDSSMGTLKKKQMASRVFAVGGHFVGSTISGNTQSGNDHSSRSYSKSTGKSADSSAFSNYRASQAISNDAASVRGRIIQNASVTTVTVVKADKQLAISDKWTSGSNNAVSKYVYGLYYANGYWVAVGGYGVGDQTISYTTDITSNSWRSPTNSVGFSQSGDAVFYANGYWVAVGHADLRSNTKSIIWTTDPTQNWQYITGTTFFDTIGHAIIYAGGYWVAVGDDSDSTKRILWTTDPTGNWNVATGTNVDANRGIAYDGSTYWVAVGNTSTPIVWTTDPRSGWVSVTGNTYLTNIGSVAYANGYWVAVGSGGGSTIIWTTDPRSGWTPSTGTSFGFSGLSVKYADGHWVAVGQDTSGGYSGDTILSTIDPRSGWTRVNGPTFNFVGQSIANGGGYWVAGGSPNQNIMYAPSNTNTTVSTTTPTTTTTVTCNTNLPAPPKPYFNGCAVNNGGLRQATTVSLSGSDFARQKIISQLSTNPIPHNKKGDKPCGPLFVDDTISLGGYSNCCISSSPAVHAQKDIFVPPPRYNPNPPSQSNGAYAPMGLPVTQTPSYKAGAYISKPATYSLGATKHHGNDMNVNPKQEIVPYQGPPGPPPHLRLNQPMQGNVKPS